MVVIRGATTIERDEKEEIQAAVKELLDKITLSNRIEKSEILSIVFSSTSDIHAYYPAKAAREAGYESSSLFSSMEPEIDGGLPLCIRVMLFLEKNILPKHIYLRGARVLRKDVAEKFNVAIDGPAGSGKSTVAKALAHDYKILYLDTGAMYRACALAAMQACASLDSEEEVARMAETLSLDVEYRDGVQHTLLFGKDVSEEIREPSVSMAASTVSKYPSIRAKMVEKQREIAAKMSCVLDGRDIGSVVLPAAEFKFFLTASPDVRAKRRFDELKAKGHDVNFDDLKKEIQARDLQDSTREFSPLKVAEDAVVIDTSCLSVQEVLAEIKRKIQEKI